jgi:uncharacterized protein (TIGR02678 family)
MTVWTDELFRARGDAVRILLGRPLLHQAADPQAFALVLLHRSWLVPWFDDTCGWRLHVDGRDGVARLHKRTDRPDPSRPAVRPRRSRAAQRPFDPRRYQLLCLICADLVRRPATTISLLAAELESVTRADAALDAFEPAERQTERRAFVDALKLLAGWGVLRTSGGDVAEFVDDPAANAIVEVDQSRLHQLLASATAPSTVAEEIDGEIDEVGDGRAAERSPDGRAGDPVARLVREPRYGAASDDDPDADEQQRNRWRRHSLARRLLDDPVVHLDELTDGQRDYLTSQAGRQWLRARVAEAGLVLEERAEGWAAVDPDAIATDRVFPAPGDNAKQAALLLLDRLVEHDEAGDRRLVERRVDDLEASMVGLLDRYGGWEKQAREGDGPARLTAAAIRVLSEMGLVRVEDDRVVPRPMLARYTTRPPRTDTLTLPGLEGN